MSRPLNFQHYQRYTTLSMSKPEYLAYVVREQKGEDSKGKGYWNKIGAVFPHKDGKGFDLALDGRLVLRAPKTEPEITA
jgi:hypothetical protein